MSTLKPTYEQLEKLYEEVCRENEKLRTENAELRASRSEAVSFVYTRILFCCNAASRTCHRRKNIASTAFGRRTKRSNTRDKRRRALNVLSRKLTNRSVKEAAHKR